MNFPKIKNIFVATAMTAMLSSCGNSFLDLNPHQQIDDKIAIVNPEDIATALNGVYYRLGGAAFCGRTYTALADVASDNTVHSAATSHLISLHNYTYSEADSYLEGIWESAYKVIDNSSRIIVAAEKMMETAHTSKLDLIKSGLAQAYGLRAYATFSVMNVFALPYTSENLNAQGAVLVYQPIEAGTMVSRSTVKESYAYILEQLEKAKEYANGLAFGASKHFYMNNIAIEALDARVKLYMNDFSAAKIAAEKALKSYEEANGSDIVTDKTSYAKMYDENTDPTEAIFLIAKSASDYLSANSINTLYTNYGLGMSSSLIALYNDTDIRKEKLTKYVNNVYKGGKFESTITNVPVFRLPELYLIIAECEAEAGDAGEAAEALYEVAKRDLSIDSSDDLPSDLDALKSFIVDERRRELYQEGHRLFDARRRGETLSINDNTSRLVNGMYLYPIPAAEINSGFGVVQNENWMQYYPVKN